MRDHNANDNYFYSPSLCKIEKYNIKWEIMNSKNFVLKIARVIISKT